MVIGLLLKQSLGSRLTVFLIHKTLDIGQRVVILIVVLVPLFVVCVHSLVVFGIQALMESGRRYGQIVFNYRYPVTIILVMTSSVRLFFRLLRVATSFGSEGVYELAPNTAVCAQLYGLSTTVPPTIPYDMENYGTPLQNATCKYVNYDIVPPVCTTSIPNINHGVISRELVAGHVATGQGSINCNKSANVSIYVMYNDPISKTDVIKSPSGSQLSHTLTISLDGKDYVSVIESTIEGGNTPIYISDSLGTEAAVAGEYLGSTIIVFDYR